MKLGFAEPLQHPRVPRRQFRHHCTTEIYLRHTLGLYCCSSLRLSLLEKTTRGVEWLAEGLLSGYLPITWIGYGCHVERSLLFHVRSGFTGERDLGLGSAASALLSLLSVCLHPQRGLPVRAFSLWPLRWSVQCLPPSCEYGSTNGPRGKMSLSIYKWEEIFLLFMLEALSRAFRLRIMSLSHGLIGLLRSVTALPKAAFFPTPTPLLLFTTSGCLYPLSSS